jgi:hypothetical protein
MPSHRRFPPRPVQVRHTRPERVSTLGGPLRRLLVIAMLATAALTQAAAAAPPEPVVPDAIATTAGTAAEVPYTADYYFWKGRTG